MSNDEKFITENINAVREQVKLAAERVGRNPSDVTILAVTKTVDVEKIGYALNAGIKDIGENRVQELLKKYDQLHGKANIHFIGHLQTNKVKDIVNKVDIIHSIDSIKLASELQKQAERFDSQFNALIQVNVSMETTKNGIGAADVSEFLNTMKALSRIKVKGFMTIAALNSTPYEKRQVFRCLYQIFVDSKLKKNNNIDMEYLSMGMSNDYVTAVEEGANIIRLGTAIFGERR